MKRSAILVLLIVAATVAVRAQDPAPREISITAKRFEFTPNQITLKRGEPVTLHVSALDRDHGFYQKDLKIDLDLTPDHESLVTITPETAGRYVAICDNFCGSGHGNMKMVINVE
ncbi:MAG TPA: cupredoxin domain-containing protein [Thermoanaerobaculia bacterium]|jgi:cytochrome c oxidase subunit 2|nr:cupredoxin domain-containing protein [Thermoanaerobaculia bacterium]